MGACARIWWRASCVPKFDLSSPEKNINALPRICCTSPSRLRHVVVFWVAACALVYGNEGSEGRGVRGTGRPRDEVSRGRSVRGTKYPGDVPEGRGVRGTGCPRDGVSEERSVRRTKCPRNEVWTKCPRDEVPGRDVSDGRCVRGARCPRAKRPRDGVSEGRDVRGRSIGWAMRTGTKCRRDNVSGPPFTLWLTRWHCPAWSCAVIVWPDRLGNPRVFSFARPSKVFFVGEATRVYYGTAKGVFERHDGGKKGGMGTASVLLENNRIIHRQILPVC